MIKISVIITVFNESKSDLQECLRSVLLQTLRNNEFDIILVDDCSTNPDTLEIIEHFKKSVPRVQVIQLENNVGLNEARRIGLRAAGGDYIIFVDGDDFITSDAIESLRIQALRSSADVVTSFFFRLNSANHTYEKMTLHGTLFPAEYNKRLEAFFSGSSSFTMCGRLFRRTMLTDEIFEMPRVFHEDMITFGRIMFKADRISGINRHIYYYRWNPVSTTSKVTEQHIDGVCLAIADWNRQAQLQGLGEELADAIAKKTLLVLDSIVRRILYAYVDDVKLSFKILTYLWDRLLAFQTKLIETSSRQGPKLLREVFAGSGAPTPATLLSVRKCFGLGKRPAQFDSAAILPEGLQQSEIAHRLAGAIVIICQVNYHVRSAACLLPELRKQEYPCIIMDNSSFVANGLRQASEDDRFGIQKNEYIQVNQGPYDSGWLATAALVVTYNDFNDDFREALEFRRLLGLPTVCVVEGINDFLRIDFDEPRYLPYRRCETVFLSGKSDQPYFSDRETYVTGLPLIEDLVDKKAEFPLEPLAVLNVNFTYGVLEDSRNGFIASAAVAFEEVGWQWVITKHPMEKDALDGMPVSKLTQNELIDNGTVFVSRFATGILEALASGKPAIYFNPHGEQVEKFKVPLGAFSVANNTKELVAALKNVLREIKAGVDFRKRALPFLKHHTGYAPDGLPSGQKFAEAIGLIMQRPFDPTRQCGDNFYPRPSKQLSELKGTLQFLGIGYTNAVVQEKKQYKLSPPVNTNWLACKYSGYIAPGKTISGRVSFFLKKDCTLNIMLCRHGNTPFEKTFQSIRFSKGNNTLKLRHTFKYHHQGARLQIGVIDQPVIIGDIKSEMNFDFSNVVAASKSIFLQENPTDVLRNKGTTTTITVGKEEYEKQQPMGNSLIIIGNGPSLCDFDFHQLKDAPTLGMNVAFRHWHRINWFPSYYICLDTVVIESQKDNICTLIKQQSANGIQLFLLRRNILSFYPELQHNPAVLFLEDYLQIPAFKGATSITTGSHAALLGALLGYRHLCLIGIDCQYEQQISEAQKVNGYVLEMSQTPDHNPNYFFDDYQQKGDRFNIPDSKPNLHYNSWVLVKKVLDKMGVDVVNCSPISKLDMFDYVDIETVLKNFEAETAGESC